METIKIGIIDDQNIFRQSLVLLIKSVPEFEMVAEAATASMLLSIFDTLPAQIPDILLMDMNMPEMNGIELNKFIADKYPAIRVIVLSVHSQDRLISKMITSGAAAYLVKNCNKEELIAAIKSTYETGFYMNKQVLMAIQQANRSSSKTISIFNSPSLELTPREKEVLALICKENSSAEIAEKLFLSVRTVEGHRNNLLLKTQSRNTAGLVLFAIRHLLFEVL
ncbi:response regulator transcription factor [Pedobacter frigiditerrae]|uniref:Response regulator transcription factor n=1 Tax=Pedobacter frigiditerrae TaxID=2530452 RepID=A0A4R0MSS7_9SPHI|nr:response regulator transcription factor [Pedobacter frigiditerrae]TCC90055.1 response regulator transcription factor [Pedobacter frigiditerrae]